MRKQLKLLRDKRHTVSVIEENENVIEDRWIYCGRAETLFCQVEVANDAAELWPNAVRRSTQVVTTFHGVCKDDL